jgi:hypothetical protein
MRSRLAAIVLIVSGVVLCAITLAQHTVPAASPFTKVVAHFKPAMTDHSIAQLRADLRVVGDGADGLSTQALPALAVQTGQTPQQLQAGLAQRYPKVTTGLQQLPGITTAFTGFADLLQAQQSNFDSVAAIPVQGVEPTTIPPALLGVGGLMVLLGLGTLLRPRSKGLPRTAVALGLAVIVTSLVTSLPHKAGDSSQLKAALAPVLTQQAIDADKGALQVMADMATQLQTQLLPDTAAALHVTPAQLAAQLTGASPALGVLFRELPQIQARFTGLVDLLDANLATWQQASKPSLVVLIRTLLACAAAAVVAGGVALSGRRRADRADLPLPVAIPDQQRRQGLVPEGQSSRT